MGEGVFEVFATAIISVLFVRMGLLRTSVATTMVIFTTIIFLGGGVLGSTIRLWNSLPSDITRKQSLEAFKGGIASSFH